MPTSTMVPAGRTTASASVIVASLPTQSTTTSAPPVRPVSRAIEPVARRTARRNSVGSTTVSAPRSRASRRCSGCLAAAMRRPGRAWLRSAAIVQRPSVPAPMTTTVSPVTPGATAAWIAHAVGSTSTAAVGEQGQRVPVHVRDERAAPAPAGVGAEARLQPGLQVPERDALTPIGGALGAGLARRVDATRRARQHRLDDDARAVVEVAHDLVPGHERKRDDGLEPARRTPRNRGQVGTADAGQTRAHPMPPGAWKRWFLRVPRERERSRLPCHARRGHAGQRSLEDERLHPAPLSFLS